MPWGMKGRFFMKLNKHLSKLVFCALLAAMTMIFKRFAFFNIDWLRLSLENTPVLLSGILFGPVAGFVTGTVGDILGCFYCGYGINPIITLGMALVGGLCGLLYRFTPRFPLLARLICAVYAAQIVGSMIVKTIGLRLQFAMPWPTLALRIPTYLIIGAAEVAIFCVLLKSRSFVRQLHKVGAQI